VRHVPRTEVGLGDGEKAELSGHSIERAHQLADGLVVRVLEGIARELLLRREVAVEASVRQPGSRHDVVEAHAPESSGAESLGRRAHDSGPRARLVLAGPRHDQSHNVAFDSTGMQRLRATRTVAKGRKIEMESAT
jgi:hypothetical protein